jgi:hypothetical protein
LVRTSCIAVTYFAQCWETVQFVTDANGSATHFLVKGGFGDVLAVYEGTYSHDRLGDLAFFRDSVRDAD